MRRLLYLMMMCCSCVVTQAQHIFHGTSLSKALIELDQSSKRYDISFVYDELEDFTVTKTIKRGQSLPKAVREVCGFYPVRVTVKGHDILVECIQKDRTKLMGRLIGPDSHPIAYANITLTLPADTVYIGGGVSNEAGDFVIPCNAERAKVRISCVGLKTIERVMPIGDVGTIRMQMENNYLGSVTINGKLPVIRNEADRLLYIVSNDAFARGLSAQELLSRVPMVTMAGRQAMILGKGPARFMLNGRITEMGDEAIQQKLWTLRSEDIERIEVISIPSGRDALEMGGGYINIVLRSHQALGWRGSLGTEMGMSDDWSGRANGSVSYASEKLDVTLDAHGGHSAQTTDRVMTYNILGVNVFSDAHAKRTNQELAANLMLRYQPVKHVELGGMLSWQTVWPEEVIDGKVNYPNTTIITTSKAKQKPDDNTSAKSLTAYCDWHLDDKGKLLSLTYNGYRKDDDGRSMVGSNYRLEKTSGGYYPVSLGEDFDSHVRYRIQSAKLDLTLPFRIATIDAGASYTHIRNQAVLEVQNSNSTSFFINYSGDMLDYQEMTKVAYLSLRRDWERFAIKAGLRYEHIGWEEDAKVNGTIRYYDLTATIYDKSKDYWLPALSLSFKPQKGHQVNLSWGTSCLRPNFYDLNPFRIYQSAYEYSEGNPLLRPSRISHVELSYQHHKGLYASAYHHHGSKMVMPVSNLSMLEESQHLSETTPLNIGRINQTGLYLRYQRQLSDRLMSTAEGDVCYHDATAQYGTSESQLNGWGSRVAVSADWYLNSLHTLMLTARYQYWFKDYRDMTENDGYGYCYFALRYALLDDRLKLSLVVNDPFHQHVTDGTIWNNTATTSKPINGQISRELIHHPFYSHTLHHSHYIGLTATYSFGGKKVHHIRHDLRNTESERAEKQ
ncbi:MAG: TonB-dependent receptor [Prevotella sp.]|nr:TonB-dependent receptor [Prevotella sp.]